MTQTTDLAFVNDWSELEWALHEVATEMHSDEYLYDCDLAEDCRWCPSEYKKVLSVFTEYVPRLLTQYANLVELSFALTEGWETYATLNAPTGLYLPDNR